MIQNNEENRQKLATTIVEGWDLSDLIYYAAQTLENDMEGWEDSDFKAEWENVFDEIQPEEGSIEE